GCVPYVCTIPPHLAATPKSLLIPVLSHEKTLDNQLDLIPYRLFDIVQSLSICIIKESPDLELSTVALYRPIVYRKIKKRRVLLEEIDNIKHILFLNCLHC